MTGGVHRKIRQNQSFCRQSLRKMEFGKFVHAKDI